MKPTGAGAAAALLGALLLVAVPAGATSYPGYAIQNYQFKPAAATIHLGDTVIWTNLDAAPHTVTSSSGPTTLSSPTLNKGGQWSYTFTRPGTYAYYCTVHPTMRATLTVAAAPTGPAATTTTTSTSTTRSRAATTTVPAAAPEGAATTTTTAVASTTSTSVVAAASAGSANAGAQSAAPVLAQTAGTSTAGPQVNPLLFLAAVAAGVAVFGVVVLGGRRREGR